MEIKVKGKISLEDLKQSYKESAGRSVFYRLLGVFLRTFLLLEIILLSIMYFVIGKMLNPPLFIIMVFYLLYVYWRKLYFPKAVKKIYESDKGYQLENELTFIENQFEAKDELHQEIIRKEDICYITISENAVYFYKSKVRAEIVPKKYFHSEEQWSEFIEFVKNNYVSDPKMLRIYKSEKLWMKVLAVLAAVIILAVYVISLVL